MEHPHILVVDDEPQITRVLRTTLVAKGMRFVSPTTARWRSRS